MGAELASRYYLEFGAAFVRGVLPEARALDDDAAFAAGEAAGLRLHRFKRSMDLPRVQRVLGILRGLGVTSLADIGSGRGAFLWPLLDQFPGLMVTAVERNTERAGQLGAVRRGGLERLLVAQADVCAIPLADRSVEAVTMLEVLEHLPAPEQALREILRVARQWVIVSVPSQPDDNPEHLHLFEARQLQAMLRDAGAARIQMEHVLNHRIALGRVAR